MPVRYRVDPGSLGIFSSYQASQLIRDAFSIWQNVDTATIRFQSSGQFSEDITRDNVLQLFQSTQSDRVNVIVFDDDGSILDLLLGEESARTILGLTQSGAATDGRIQYARVILNGRYAGRNGYPREAYLHTVIHELGHSIGLDHSQLFRHLAQNRYGPDDKYVPVLYPVTSDDETERLRLATDDRISVSTTYSHPSFATQYGEIQGKVLLEGERSFPGVNVVARKVDEPLTVATTSVSDYLRRGNGAYRLAGLPPGEYLLWIEPIDPKFHGTSQVGPYAETSSGLSFTRVAKSEFYNGARETFDESLDNRSEAVTVAVKPGQIVKNIDFRANHNPSPGDERSVQILTSGMTETGAVAGRPGYRTLQDIQFLYIVSSKDDVLRVELDTEPLARMQVHIRHEAPVEFENYDARREGLGHITLVRSRESSPPLKTGRYFIAVANVMARTIPYTLTVRTTRYPEGDLNRDGSTDRLDLYRFSAHWGESVPESGAREDLVPSAANRIDQADLRRLIRLLTTTPP